VAAFHIKVDFFRRKSATKFLYVKTFSNRVKALTGPNRSQMAWLVGMSGTVEFNTSKSVCAWTP